MKHYIIYMLGVIGAGIAAAYEAGRIKQPQIL